MTTNCSEDKTFSRKHESEAQGNDSITEVHFNLGGKRKPCSFRCNEKLWKAFVSKCKAEYGSVCHVLEPIISTLTTNKVHLSNTIRPLRIENLVVERAVKRVRRYGIETFEEETTSVAQAGCAVCGEKAYAVVTRADKSRVSLCRRDFQKEKPRLQGWGVIE